MGGFQSTSSWSFWPTRSAASSSQVSGYEDLFCSLVQLTTTHYLNHFFSNRLLLWRSSGLCYSFTCIGLWLHPVQSPEGEPGLHHVCPATHSCAWATKSGHRATRPGLHNTHNLLGGRSGPSAVQVSQWVLQFPWKWREAQPSAENANPARIGMGSDVLPILHWSWYSFLQFWTAFQGPSNLSSVWASWKASRRYCEGKNLYFLACKGHPLEREFLGFSRKGSHLTLPNKRAFQNWRLH